MAIQSLPSPSLRAKRGNPVPLSPSLRAKRGNPATLLPVIASEAWQSSSPSSRHCERSVAIQSLSSPSGKKQKSLIANDRLFCSKSRPITLQRQTFHLLFKSLLPHLLAHLLRSTYRAAPYATSMHRWCL